MSEFKSWVANSTLHDAKKNLNDILDLISERILYSPDEDDSRAEEAIQAGLMAIDSLYVRSLEK